MKETRETNLGCTLTPQKPGQLCGDSKPAGTPDPELLPDGVACCKGRAGESLSPPPWSIQAAVGESHRLVAYDNTDLLLTVLEAGSQDGGSRRLGVC